MNHIKSIFFTASVLLSTTSHAQIDAYYQSIKNDPNALYAFYKAMPKGGELHYHLAGGPYPETMLNLAAHGDYCVNKSSFAITTNTKDCDGVAVKDLHNQPELYNSVIRSWSLKDFTPGTESSHDHFFNSFIKFMPIVSNLRAKLLADVMFRASQQHELYLEILDIPDNANSLGFADLIGNSTSYDEKRKLLLADPKFQSNITLTIDESEKMLHAAKQELGCERNSKATGCEVEIKILYYVLREQPLNTMFAQTLNAFEAVSRSPNALVGVNLVQPEDGIISLRDYHQQMAVFEYFHKMYPQVKISLHAGELTPDIAAPKDLNDHIYEALFTAKALRIGHGSDISYEKNPQSILNYMAKQQIPVEINLISNKKLLNLSGPAHPLNYYLKNQVPVVLSTDDEGILRTDLTAQYVEAAMVHGLDYQALKQISRNTLTFAFIKGKSLWANSAKAQPVKECVDLNSTSCKEFITANEKAQLQWDLENKLKAFELGYDH